MTDSSLTTTTAIIITIIIRYGDNDDNRTFSSLISDKSQQVNKNRNIGDLSMLSHTGI